MQLGDLTDLALQQSRQGRAPGLTFADDDGLLRAMPESGPPEPRSRNQEK
jgi:hypothetical protein